MKAQIVDIGGENQHERIVWYCPGCKCHHGVPIPPHRGAWSWNSSLDEPTLTPSVIVQYDGQKDRPAFCHCFVREGKIEFLSDCAHEFAGKTIEMRRIEMP